MEWDREKQGTLILGAALGAALMFILDPARGARRRSIARDKSAKWLRQGGRAIHDRSEDIKNRLSGAAAEFRAKGAPPPTNLQLEERVRAELGHQVENAKAIDVIAENGQVTLRGNVLRNELDQVLRTVQSVNGVREVRSEMFVRSDEGEIPSLQS